MKTIAAVLYNIGRKLELEELEIPGLKAGQALVKIAYSGLCHSQLNEINGLKGEDRFLPHTLGHEGSGVVEAVGQDVKKVKTGDNVVMTWIKGLGSDISSATYKKSNGTKVNSGAIATFLTHAVVSENRLVKIDKDMPLKEAALLGCAIPTGAGIVKNTMGFMRGSNIAIFGIGGIGLSALLMSKYMGASDIIAVDVVEEKLKHAAQLGATHVINARKNDILSNIFEVTNGCGLDYAVECVGRKESMEAAFKSVRDNGGLCVIAGNLPKGQEIMLDPFDLINGKHIIGTWGGETMPDRDIPMYVDMFISGKLDLENLIGSTYGIEDINEAFNKLAGGITGRVLIDAGNEH